MQTNESTPSLLLEEKWTITVIPWQLNSMLTYSCSQMSFLIVKKMTRTREREFIKAFNF